VDFGTKTDIPKSWGLGGLGGCLVPCKELMRFFGAQQERGHKGPLCGFSPLNSSQVAEQEVSRHRLSLWEASRGADAFYVHVAVGTCYEGAEQAVTAKGCVFLRRSRNKSPLGVVSAAGVVA
jgi:hypothetical protein